MIKDNLLIILTVCNVFSIGVCAVTIYNFAKAIANSKEERQKRKQKLYFNSAIFVLFLLLLVLTLLLTPYFPALFWVGDITMDVLVACALLFWWT